MKAHEISDRIVDKFGKQGVYLFVWGLFCFSIGFTIEPRYPWDEESGVFYTAWPIWVRASVWWCAGISAMGASLFKITKVRAAGFFMVALAIFQRITGDFMAFLAWVLPDPPMGDSNSFWWALAYSAMFVLLWLNARWSPTAEEDLNG